MSDTFYLKTGDTSPIIQYTLSPTVDLTGATVVFNMKDASGTSVVDRGAASAVSPATDGVVQYAWQSADTDTAGSFRGEFEVTYSDATIETFPNYGYITIRISGDLG